MRTVVLSLTGVLALLSAFEPCRADRGRDFQIVDTFVQDMGGSDYTITPVHGPYLAKTFPDYKFYAVYFRQWPVQTPPPPGLSQSNVFYMNRATQQVGYLTSPEELRQFFVDYWSRFVRATGGSHLVVEIAKDWLALSEQFSQDGFFEFSKPAAEAVGNTAYGFVSVTSGGSGYIEVIVTFNPTGGLSIDETRHVITGDRPI